MELLEDNLALIAGVANDKSIAWAIAQAVHLQGARVVMSYQNDALGKRVIPLAESIGARAIPCDFTKSEEVDALFMRIAEMEIPLRYAVHSIAFSKKEELNGNFLDVSDENFDVTMRVSCLSFITMVKHCASFMLDNYKVSGERGSIVGLTYGASERPHPHYNIMSVAKAALGSAMRNAAFQLGPDGIRTNLVSPSPEDTLSARGIKGFRHIGRWADGMSMLGRRVTLEEIAETVVFLLSGWASGITAQTIMVDGGASVSGMPPLRHARIIGQDMMAIADEVEGVRPSTSRGQYLDHSGEVEGEGDDVVDELKGSSTPGA